MVNQKPTLRIGPMHLDGTKPQGYNIPDYHMSNHHVSDRQTEGDTQEKYREFTTLQV